MPMGVGTDRIGSKMLVGSNGWTNGHLIIKEVVPDIFSKPLYSSTKCSLKI